MRLLRTIRLDPSDGFVFASAAAPGEWAVPGSFAFWDEDPATLTGKARAAFRAGFLGVESLGWSTLVEVVEAEDADRDALVAALARQLVARFGAPDLAQAAAAAAEEVAFAGSLCEHPPGTLIALQRRVDADGIRESFRTLRPREPGRPRDVFAFLTAPDDDAPADGVDLVSLAREPRP